MKQEFTSLFRNFDIAEPSIQGKACGHKLERMCVVGECPHPSLHCHNMECEKSYEQHNFCRSVTLKGSTDLLNLHFRSNREFLTEIFRMEDAYMQEYTKKRVSHSKEMSIDSLEEKYQKTIRRLFFEGSGEGIKAKEADELFTKLLWLSKVSRRSNQLLHKYEEAVSRAFAQLAAAKEALLQEYLSPLLGNYAEAVPNAAQSMIGHSEDDCLDISQLQQLTMLHKGGERRLQENDKPKRKDQIEERFLDLVSNATGHKEDLSSEAPTQQKQHPGEQSRIHGDVIPKDQQNQTGPGLKLSVFAARTQRQRPIIMEVLPMKNKVVIYSLLNDTNCNLGKMDTKLKKMDAKLEHMCLAKPIMEEMVPKMKQMFNNRMGAIEQKVREIQLNISKINIKEEGVTVGIKQIHDWIQIQQESVDSKILKNDSDRFKKTDYVLKQLGRPSQLKLLFRASQHSFSAGEFHRLCDNIPNTVTIVRTKFGRTIAAYTPLKWQAIEGGADVEDPSLSSFLLQLELREKMTLIKGQESYAIWKNKNWGPAFGGGRDLCIADKCNENRDSYAYFPKSYNSGGKYINNQKSYTALSGATDGYKFRVVDYEVFQVIK